MTTLNCGCGDYGIEVSDYKPIYTFGAVCPKCGNHFGFDASNEVEENCPTCGAGPSFQSLLWTDPDGAARGESPDWVGCDECRTLRPVDEDVKEITFDKFSNRR